eukprot:723595-Ditylum_brightwellii.AAC.1
MVWDKVFANKEGPHFAGGDANTSTSQNTSRNNSLQGGWSRMGISASEESSDVSSCLYGSTASLHTPN